MTKAAQRKPWRNMVAVLAATGMVGVTTLAGSVPQAAAADAGNVPASKAASTSTSGGTGIPTPAGTPRPSASSSSVPTAAAGSYNGIGLKPALGWSSWSFLRYNPTAAAVEAQADAMQSSGLAKVGYQYVNLDDFYIQCPSGGPAVDSYGRWATDTTKFPSSGAEDGIKVVADHVHKDGLKFGLYVTPGISKQAVAQNTPIEGTPYHADDIAEPNVKESNYNCGNMVGIDFTKPGAQEFINSWANKMAAEGVDYLKIDGVGSGDIADVQAWSKALTQTGRSIHFELSNSLNINDAATWKRLSNGWRTGGDIECYCGKNGSSFPLTDWGNINQRFDAVASWAPYGGPGGFNDYDSLELGNGSNDGLTPDERQTQLSLWALASAPLLLGSDLTHLDATDLGYLKNRQVLAVDQDAIDATRLVNTSSQQVFRKTEPNGDVIVGLFNVSGAFEHITTTASALGLRAAKAYQVNDLWSHRITETAGTIDATVPTHGVALYRLTALDKTNGIQPRVSFETTPSIGGSYTSGAPLIVADTFTNYGVDPAKLVTLSLHDSVGWKIQSVGPTTFGTVRTGQTVTAYFAVTPGKATDAITTAIIKGRAVYDWQNHHANATSETPLHLTNSVQSPYLTYSSATDGPTYFGQLGQNFAISGAGADLYGGSDNYTTIYQKGVVTDGSTIQTKVTSQSNMSGFAKAGILVGNDITASGSAPEGVILYESPGGGIQMEWDNNSGNGINAVTPGNGTIPATLPVWLKLVRTGSTYTGSYSTDGSTWTQVGTVTVPGQAATQDAGLFVVSHTAGVPGLASFQGFSVS
ncbi:MAG: NEW3 domain-containing protein [Nakamurella sp.]